MPVVDTNQYKTRVRNENKWTEVWAKNPRKTLNPLFGGKSSFWGNP